MILFLTVIILTTVPKDNRKTRQLNKAPLVTLRPSKCSGTNITNEKVACASNRTKVRKIALLIFRLNFVAFNANA